MLKDHDSSAIVAVRDLARARAFYDEVLGLQCVDKGDEEGVLVYDTGGTKLVVYKSDEAGTNRANGVVWGVGDDIDAIVTALEAKGADFQHYKDVGTLDGNVHRFGDVKLVWIKDPDGNILHINNI